MQDRWTYVSSALFLRARGPCHALSLGLDMFFSARSPSFSFFGLPALCGEPEAPVSLLPEPFCLVFFGVPALCRWEIEVLAPLPDPLSVSLLVWAPALRGEEEDPVIPQPRPIQLSGAPTLCR